MDFQLYTIERRGILFKSYDIYENEILRFRVSGKPFSFLKDFRMFDHNGLEILQIKRKFSLFKMQFQLRHFDEPVADIVSRTVLKSTNLDISSSYGDYTVNSNFWKTEFTVLKGPEEVAKISRKRSPLKRKYGVAIAPSEEPVFILALTIVIEIVIRVLRARKN